MAPSKERSVAISVPIVAWRCCLQPTPFIVNNEVFVVAQAVPDGILELGTGTLTSASLTPNFDVIFLLPVSGLSLCDPTNKGASGGSHHTRASGGIPHEETAVALGLSMVKENRPSGCCRSIL